MALPTGLVAGSTGHIAHHNTAHGMLNAVVTPFGIAPVLIASFAASRPAAGQPGRLFGAVDTDEFQWDDGSAWHDVGGGGGGGFAGFTFRDPRDYDADWDNSADDEDEINACLDDGPGVVLFPQGTARVNAPVIGKQSVSLFGYGRERSKLRGTFSTADRGVLEYDATMYDGGIALSGFGVDATGGPDFGVILGGEGKDTQIFAHNRVGDIRTYGGDVAGMLLSNCVSIPFYFVECASSSFIGFYSYPNLFGDGYVNDCTFYKCRAANNALGGIRIQGGWGNQISDCVFETNGAIASETFGVSIIASVNTSVERTWLESTPSFQRHGIIIETDNAPTLPQAALIRGNTFSSEGEFGIWVRDSASQIDIENNSFNNDPLNGPYHIRVDSGSTGIAIRRSKGYGKNIAATTLNNTTNGVQYEPIQGQGSTQIEDLQATYHRGFEWHHQEAATPAAVANEAIVYAQDNGSGKTKLMVRFGSGSPVQLAIEP